MFIKLVNDARSGDFVLNFKPLKLADLQDLVRETKVLERCKLLQDLGIVSSKTTVDPNLKPKPKPNPEIKEFLLNFVRHYQFLGEQTLIKQAKTKFAEVAETDINRQIQKLVEEQKISVVNPNAKPEERLICLIPQAVAGGKK